jgi:hypothetical protein
MKKEMLINVSQSEECRIALLEDGTLEELYTERTSQNNWVGNIYKGRIVNIEPSIQAAFVDRHLRNMTPADQLQMSKAKRCPTSRSHQAPQARATRPQVSPSPNHCN